MVSAIRGPILLNLSNSMRKRDKSLFATRYEPVYGADRLFPFVSIVN